jgi:hypothetical protein
MVEDKATLNDTIIALGSYLPHEDARIRSKGMNLK